MERSVCARNTFDGAANVVVKVQWAVTDPGIDFRVDDWSLSIEKWKQCQAAP